ncbi:signal peptide peptidase SppA [Luteimonas sp. RD2P54]|uniref:Signal peptide peptidase SppA n=1 Tax=Luteimonas endophytica TaxID=3042023 RepID=A0ABT6J6J6_9GAMM|nr:signal peptide peptidase SppA [Luteimonas endophytica]MDH5822426.1 signal peptide peptidase SppA [Luteimonas endophytica]
MNEPRRRGPVARLLGGIWDAMNFTRRLVFNLLFFALLLFVLAVLAAGDTTRPMLDRTTLVIAPEGRIVEQYTTDPASRALARMLGDDSAPEVQLRDLLRAIEAAAADENVERVYLRVDRLQPSGIAILREVAGALRDLRAGGKQIVAYGESFSQGAYLLAAQADEIYIDPMGSGVGLEGFASYGPYFGEALQDKLGVDVHVFKVGEFKSAVEPYVLNAASPEAKQADLYWLNDLWQRHLADIAEARGLSVEQLEAGIDGMADGVAALGGDLARYALEQGLVDGLKTSREVEDLLVERGVADEDAEAGFRSVDLDGYLAHVDGGLPRTPRERQVAVVVAEGAISDGIQPPGSVGGESTAALLREALEDEHVKAVVLRVNSPGGSAYASEQINREVVALKAAGKPVVASMGHVAASGGYWISMNADRIFADPSTITGSIGVFGLFPNITRTLDRIGVHTDGVGTTRLAGAFDITRPLEPDVGRLIQASIEKIYNDFVDKVAAGRGARPAAIDRVARGRVWSGAQARDRGLVDELGGFRAAIADAARRAELGEGDYRVRYIEKEASPFAKFMADLAGTRAGAVLLRDAGLAQLLLARTVPELERHVRVFEQALANDRGVAARGMAYCFCPVF